MFCTQQVVETWPTSSQMQASTIASYSYCKRRTSSPSRVTKNRLITVWEFDVARNADALYWNDFSLCWQRARCTVGDLWCRDMSKTCAAKRHSRYMQKQYLQTSSYAVNQVSIDLYSPSMVSGIHLDSCTSCIYVNFLGMDSIIIIIIIIGNQIAYRRLQDMSRP